MMDGLRVYYNFMRPHMALNRKTPAQKEKIVFDSENVDWKALIRKANQSQKPLLTKGIKQIPAIILLKLLC